jgi:hypothetical protein
VRNPGFGVRPGRPPIVEPHQVDRRRSQDMLEACFGLPDVMALAQAAAPDGLLVRFLDTGTRSVLASEFCSFLSLASRAQRLMMLLRLQTNGARLQL